MIQSNDSPNDSQPIVQWGTLKTAVITDFIYIEAGENVDVCMHFLVLGYPAK